MSFVRCSNKLVTLGKPRMPPSSSPSQPTFSGLIGEQFIKNDTNGSLNNQPLTIYGPTKTAQPRRCSCSSNVSIDKSSSNNNINSNIGSKLITKSVSSSSVLNSSTSPSSLDLTQPKTSKESSSLDNFRRDNEDNLQISINSDSQITLLNKTQRNTIKRYIYFIRLLLLIRIN